MSSKGVKWSPAPRALPMGAMMVVLAGDPTSTGPAVLRLRMPAGYRILPHWHPTDERVTVLSGTLFIGLGDELNPTKARAIAAGDNVLARAYTNHSAWTKTGATVQIDLTGPFQITYVDPA